VQAIYGPKTVWNDITEVQITNLQGESLGRIQDLVLDLTNGRVVEVLVVYDQTLRFGGKMVAVPPRALIPDAVNKVYQINMSVALFKAAPQFNPSKWKESTQPDKVAAAYHYFGQEPNFLLSGEKSGRTTAAGRVVTSLGIVERLTYIMNLEVDDLTGAKLGRLKSLSLDVPDGRILNAFISVSKLGTNFQYDTVVPPMLLSFNAAQDGLLLDVAKVSYSDEPRVILENGAGDQITSFREQAAHGPRVNVALVQGTSFRDINTSLKIYQAIQAANLEQWGVEVATLEGRVTLRGNVESSATKVSIGAIAIALARLENVDNQIEVGLPPPPAS
jgi:sporulation protein YlmC with PRC-barrel domain